MSEKLSKDYLKNVTLAIRFLNKKARKEVYKRGLDVLPEVMALKEYASGLPIKESRDICRQAFLTGVQRYLIGFYEDSIYHSTLSVETGLLIRLDETLTPQQRNDLHDKINSKNKPFLLTFGKLFSLCKSNQCIINDKKIERIIDKIIQTRNSHIHASNMTSASILSMKKLVIPEIEKGVKDLEIIEKSPFGLVSKKWLPRAKDTLAKSRDTLNDLPSFEWCTEDNQRVKNEKFMDDFLTRQFNAIQNLRNTDTLSRKVTVGLHSREILSSFSQINYSKEKALETIHEAFEVIKAIGFLDNA